MENAITRINTRVSSMFVQKKKTQEEF